MCGIAGVARRDSKGVSRETLLRMAAVLRHRGPDGVGIAPGPRVGLAHTRLSIIDIARGAQPLTNEDGEIMITYNGEVYNYRELRVELQGKGHQFRTHTDTEVLVHAYEQWGPAMLSRLNGQFAFAIYDRRTESVFLARDRFGVRPLFYAMRGGDLLFASEIKALLATGEVPAALSHNGLDEVFTFWAARAPRTPFANIYSLEPGCFAVWRNGQFKITRYYALNFPEATDEPHGALLTLDELMRTGVSLRMRADVPVGGYLSGGLDSSITCALASSASPYALRTFSVTFDDPALDESGFQRVVARDLGSEHDIAHIGALDIAKVFPDVIKHAETPLVRTAPAPMFLLSRLTRDRGIKVVLTGEGSDELFLGYDIFKETAVRLFCERQPTSKMRPRLFDRLYPYLGGTRGGEFWRQSFLNGGTTDDPLYSHIPRFQLTSRIKDFYSSDMRMSLVGADAQAELRASLPSDFHGWSPANRAVYLEMVTLLSSYLLSSQGDRMGMAHGVEGRFPFLDHRLFEFAAALPTKSKLRGLREKDILRRWAKDVVPAAVIQRSKQPYRAPDAPAFFGNSATPYVEELLSDTAIRNTGIFDPRAVHGLVRRCRAGQVTGFAENQALVAVLSTQLWCEQFLSSSAVRDDVAHTFKTVEGPARAMALESGQRTTLEQFC
jgi:asparagine synthase (glutamine-hydrolysing)